MNTPHPRRFRLLLMSVGSLVGTALLECIDALGREHFELIGMNSEAGAVNNFRMDVCYLSYPAFQRRELLDQLDRLVHLHAPDLIVPLRDDDVVALAQWANGRDDARALVGSLRMAEVIRDKWTSYLWACENRLPFARSAIDVAGVAKLRNMVGFPLVAKPRKGFGSNDVRMLLSDEHIEVALATGDTIVQEAIDPSPMLTAESLKGGMPLWFAPVQPGSPLALVLLDNSGCRFLASWWSRHVRGAALDTVLLHDAALEQLAMNYAQAAWRDGWRGLFNIQARRNASGEYIPIELAGRFMGGINALHKLGIPVAAIVFGRFLASFDMQQAPAPNYQARAVKQVVTHVIPREQEFTLLNRGVWRRP